MQPTSNIMTIRVQSDILKVNYKRLINTSYLHYSKQSKLPIQNY